MDTWVKPEYDDVRGIGQSPTAPLFPIAICRGSH